MKQLVKSNPINAHFCIILLRVNIRIEDCYGGIYIITEQMDSVGILNSVQLVGMLLFMLITMIIVCFIS